MYDQSDPMMMGAFSFIPLLAFILIAILFAIGFAKIAGRMGKSPVLWAVLSLVPVVNYFFWIYAMFVILLYVLDRLNAIGAKLGAESPAK
jgi:hypothetical protein